MNRQPDANEIEEVAKAIYGATVDSARESITQYDAQIGRVEAVFDTVDGETDRSAAILMFALVEDIMSQGLRHNMNEACYGGWAAVTGGNGVLATASDRISILELLYWIRPALSSQLRLMKSIRNRFAHHADVSSFNESKIQGWISSMKPGEASAIATRSVEEQASWRRYTPRELFIMRAATTITALVTDLALMPAARAYRVNPWDVAGSGEIERMPDTMREAGIVAARLLLRYIPPR